MTSDVELLVVAGKFLHKSSANGLKDAGVRIGEWVEQCFKEARVHSAVDGPFFSHEIQLHNSQEYGSDLG